MMKHVELTREIIGAYFRVYNDLGYGFLEKVYENAFALELRNRGLQVDQQQQIQVYFQGSVVGNYFADLLIESAIILELKAAEIIADAHTAQLMNYLKATTCEVGFVFNFGPEATFERRYFSNAKKKNLRNNPR